MKKSRPHPLVGPLLVWKLYQTFAFQNHMKLNGTLWAICIAGILNSCPSLMMKALCVWDPRGWHQILDIWLARH